MSPAAVPEWFELDDADFVDLLNAIRDDEAGNGGDDDDPRCRGGVSPPNGPPFP